MLGALGQHNGVVRPNHSTRRLEENHRLVGHGIVHFLDVVEVIQPYGDDLAGPAGRKQRHVFRIQHATVLANAVIRQSLDGIDLFSFRAGVELFIAILSVNDLHLCKDPLFSYISLYHISALSHSKTSLRPFLPAKRAHGFMPCAPPYEPVQFPSPANTVNLPMDSS